MNSIKAALAITFFPIFTFAADYLVADKDIIIFSKSTSSEVFRHDYLLMDDGLVCVTNHDYRDYDREIKKKTALEIVNFTNLDPMPLTVAEFVSDFEMLMGVELPEGLPFDKLFTLIEREHGVMVNSRELLNRLLSLYRFEVKSMTTDTIYKIICKSSKPRTYNEILDLFQKNGPLKPITNL